MVVIGAGASFDSWPDLPAPSPHNFRPPLADELFATRENFLQARWRFRETFSVLPELINRGRKSVEEVLQSLQAETATYPPRHQHLAAIRYYLQVLIRDVVQANWALNVTRGALNHVALFDQINRLTPAGESVCVVTFNYDTLIEEALSIAGFNPIAAIPDYIAGPRFKVFKLHGSMNWYREVLNPVQIPQDGNAWTVAHKLIEQAAALEISNRFGVATGYPTALLGRQVVFPALAIPVTTKSSFECPDEHMQALRNMIPHTRRLLTIGWRAGEAHFLKLLEEGLLTSRGAVDVLVVSGDAAGATETLERLRSARLPIGRAFNHDRGFTDAVSSRGLDAFLSLR